MIPVSLRFAALIPLLSIVLGGGITADAGLTPPLDRFIVRFQARNMQMKSLVNQMEMTTRVFPFVVAYGLSHRFTVIGRVIYRQVNYSMPIMGKSESGFSSFSIMGKTKIYRFNSAEQTVGISMLAGVGFEESGRGVAPATGFQGSYRRGQLAIDMNLEGNLNVNSNQGNLSFNSAFAWLLPVPGNGQLAVTPVLESTIQFFTDGIPTNRIWLSPGLKVTWFSYIMEVLLSNPLSESVGTMKAHPGWLVGVRLMF